MKVISFCSALLVAAFVFSADETSDARKAIEVKFAVISKAFAAKNVKAFEAAFAEDFKSKAPGKPMVGRTEVLKGFETQMKMMSDVKWTQKIKTFKLERDVAYVTFDSEMKSKIDDEDGKKHDFRLVSKTKNEWVKGKSGWLVRYSESLEIKMWYDGTEVPN